MITSIRKPISSTMLAIVAVVVLSVFTAAVAQADSGAKAKFDASGTMLFVGAAVNPLDGTVLTTAESKFSFKKNGDIKKVRVKTKNEAVSGVLGVLGPSGEIIGPAIAFGDCTDNNSMAACGALNVALTGAIASSLHDSNAVLKVTEVITAGVGGPAVALKGDLRGKLKGAFSITSPTNEVLSGSVKLSIKRGSTATYACFLRTGLPVPFSHEPTVIAACIVGEGESVSILPGTTLPADMLPVALDITDKGTFKIGSNETLGIKSIKGKLEIRIAITEPMTEPMPVGTINITKAKAKLLAP